MPTIEQARAWYPDSDPVHGFDHVLRVYRMAERLAWAEGADIEIVRAAALLHDAQGSATGGGEIGRQNHHHASAEFARLVLQSGGWPEERIAAVEHCIRAHRFRDHSESPASLEAKILFDADKLDVIGAFGVARTIAFDAVVNQPFFAPPSERFLNSGEKEPGEAHSSYHEYLFKLSKIKDRLHTATARELAEGRDRFMREFFARLAAEANGEL
ncbi:MAG TPA: HD domain-containing protein [Anaerolineales bacterium]|nr:HD domain-containing protein [Anaerolineales bacterium]